MTAEVKTEERVVPFETKGNIVEACLGCSRIDPATENCIRYIDPSVVMRNVHLIPEYYKAGREMTFINCGENTQNILKRAGLITDKKKKGMLNPLKASKRGR